jgi:hypothetical protein
VIVAHHGGELAAIVTALSGGAGALSLAGAIARDRIARFVQRWRRT